MLFRAPDIAHATENHCCRAENSKPTFLLPSLPEANGHVLFFHLLISPSILKSRDIILAKKVHLVKAMVFPVVTYGCESWIIKKAECQRIDAFELGVGEDS